MNTITCDQCGSNNVEKKTVQTQSSANFGKDYNACSDCKKFLGFIGGGKRFNSNSNNNNWDNKRSKGNWTNQQTKTEEAPPSKVAPPSTFTLELLRDRLVALENKNRC